MPLTGADWAEISAWAEKRDQRLYGHLLLNRFFQGYVTGVTGSRPYQVSLQRIGEPTADGASYMSPNPSYFPRIGDLVECVWRDDKIAYVLWPINAGALTASRCLLAPPVVVGAAAASIRFASIPGAARNLVLSGRVFGTDAAGAFINWQANGDGGSNYSSQRVYGNGASPFGQLARNAASSCYIGSASASGYATGATFTCMIPGANLAGNHVFHSIVSRFESGATVAELWANWWTAAGFAGPITQMDIWLTAGNFNTGTVFELSGDL